MAYDFDSMSNEELMRIANGGAHQAAMSPSRDFDNMSNEQLMAIASGKPLPTPQKDPQPTPKKPDDYGFTDRRHDEIVAQGGRDAYAGQEYVEGLAPFARSVRESGEREEDENQSAFLNGKALEDAIERHGDAPDESLKGYKAQQFGAVETGVRMAGHNLSKAAANLPLFIGEAVKGVRGLGRRAYNNKATDVLIDYARDAGFDDEEIERAKEHSQGDPYKMYDFFQELAEATIGHHADQKAGAAQRLAEHADEEGLVSKIAGGALGMIPMMEEFAIGGGIVKGLGLAKGAANAATWQGRLAAGLQHSKFMTPLMGSEFARRRYGELTRDEYVRDEDGNLVVKKGDNKASALAKATAGGLGEAAIFSLPIGEAVMGWAPKVVTKALRTKVSPTVAKMYKNYVKYGQLTGLRGQPVMLGLMDANTFKDEVLGLSKKDGDYEGFGKEWDKFWSETMSAKNQADLFVSTLGVMAVQGGVALAKARSAIAKENRSTDAVLKTYFEVPDELLRQMSPEHKSMWRKIIMDRSKGRGFTLNEENLRKFVGKMGDRYGEATRALYDKMAKYALEKDNSRDWMKGVEASEETSFSVPKRRNAKTGNVEVAWDDDIEDVGGRTIRTQSFTDPKTGITVSKFLPTDAGLSDDGYVYVVRDKNGRQAARHGITDAIYAARDMERAGNTAVRQRQNKANYIKELYAKNFPGESPEILDTADQYQERYGRALLPGQIARNADGKQVYILDRIETPQMAMKTVLHEVGRHRGLDFAIPDVNARAEFLRSLAASDDPVIQDRLAHIAISQGFTSPEEALKDPYVVEEVYAHLFDHEGVPAEPGAWEKHGTAIRRTMRRFFKRLPFSREEAEEVYRGAMDELSKQTGGAVTYIPEEAEAAPLTPRQEHEQRMERKAAGAKAVGEYRAEEAAARLEEEARKSAMDEAARKAEEERLAGRKSAVESAVAEAGEEIGAERERRAREQAITRKAQEEKARIKAEAEEYEAKERERIERERRAEQEAQEDAELERMIAEETRENERKALEDYRKSRREAIERRNKALAEAEAEQKRLDAERERIAQERAQPVENAPTIAPKPPEAQSPRNPAEGVEAASRASGAKPRKRPVNRFSATSRAAYDDDPDSGSTGLYRQGGILKIPVDFERTAPGGKVVFSTDDANITDYIKQVLDGYGGLVMSKTGKIRLGGERGVPKELRPLFGTSFEAGQNDGVLQWLANELNDPSIADMSPEQLHKAILADRDNYAQWAERKRRELSGERVETPEERHWREAEEADRANTAEIGGEEYHIDELEAKTVADEQYDNAFAEVDRHDGERETFDAFSRDRLRSLKTGDALRFDHADEAWEVVDYDRDGDVLTLMPEGMRDNPLFSDVEKAESLVKYAVTPDGIRELKGERNGRENEGRASEDISGDAQGAGDGGSRGAADAEGRDFALDGGTAEEIAAEQRRIRDRAEVERRLNAPLKTGKGEMGQSLLDLGGQEGGDLFNQTVRTEPAQKSSRADVTDAASERATLAKAADDARKAYAKLTAAEMVGAKGRAAAAEIERADRALLDFYERNGIELDEDGNPIEAKPAASGSPAAAPEKDAQAAAKAETQTPDAPKVEPKVALAAARRLGLLAYGSDAQLRKSLALAKEHGHDQVAKDIETIIADRKAKANLPPREDMGSIGHAKKGVQAYGVDDIEAIEDGIGLGDAPKPKTVKVSKGQISMQDAYDLFNALNSNKETGELMDKVFNVMKDADIRLAIRHLEENSRETKRERGETWSRTLGVEFGGNIELDLAYMNSSNAAQFKANTMLHEMIHAATDYAISLVDGKGRKPKDVVVSKELRDAVKDLHKIYDTVKDDFSKDYFLEYASQNVHEFIAELSNQSVRNALKKRNLWTRVVDAIRRVLRAFGGGAQESNAYEISEDVLDRFLSNFDREAFDAWRDSPNKSIDPNIPRGDLYANETRTAKMSVDGMDVRETARRLRERGASRFFDKNEELGAKVDWGDENREVKVVGGGVSPWQYKKGVKTKEAKTEIYELAQKNVAAQPNYVLDEASGNNALMLDGVKYRITKRGLFHGADRRLKNIGPAIAKIGDVLNASVEVPVDAKPWRYRIAATDFGKREYTLITSREVDGAQDVVDVQTLYSINVKSGDAARTVTSTNADRQSVGGGAARELNHTDANRPNTDIVANLKGAWQGLFEKNLAEHIAERRRRAAADNAVEKRLRTSDGNEQFFDKTEERDDKKEPSPIDRAMTRGERFRERWQDSDVVVRNVQDEIGGVEDKIDASGHTAAKTTFKEDGTVDALGSTDVYNAKDRENGYLEAGMRDIQSRTDKIDKVLAANGITPEQFDRYLYAAHAEERNRTVAERNGREYDPASGEGSGLSEIEAKKILSSPEVQRKRAAYEVAAKMLYDMNDANLRRRLESGRISQELYDLLTKQWKRYVPLRTDVENGENAAFNLSTAGFRSSEFMTAEGRKEGNMADSPYAFARLQAEQGVRGSERNIVNTTFANLVRQSIAQGKPIGEITEGRDEGRGIGWTFHFTDGDRVQVGGSGKLAENRQDIVLFKEDGKLKAIRVNPGAEGRGLALAQAVTGENVKRWAKELAWIPKATRWLSAMRTQYSPEFMFTNSLADHLEAAQALVGRYGIGSGTALAAKAVAWEAKNLKSLRAYINGGAPTGYVKEAIDGGLLIKGGVASQGFAGEVEAIKSNYDRFVRDAKKLYRMNPKELGGFVWDGMKDLVSHANELVENSTRIGIYSALRERGVSVNEAVKFARDATVNFNRRGTMMPWFNGLYMFANASVQGAVRSFQAMGDRHGAQLVSLLVAAGVAKAVLDHYFGNDDEREKAGGRNARNVSEYEKKHILGIPVGGGKQIAALRMRGPYAAIPYLAQTFTNVALGETEAEDAMHTVFREVTDQATDLVSGNGVVNDKGGLDAALVGQTLAPSLADPLVQLWTGKDYKGDWRTAKSYDQNKPLSSNGKRNTAEAYKIAAQSLNWLTGGNENRKGMIDVAPEDLQLVVEFLGGGIGRDIHNVAATTKNVAQIAAGETPERTLSQTPFLRTLLREYPESTARYYDAIDEYERDKYEIKKAKTAKEIMAVAKGKPYLSRGKTPLDERIERVKELMHLERGERKIRNRWVKVESVSDAQRETYRKMRLKLQAAILKALRK